MKAAEAQMISTSVGKAQTTKNIDKLMLIVYEKIEVAARKGGFAIDDPFAGLRLYLTDESRRAVKERLMAEGYTVFGDGTISWANSPSTGAKEVRP